MSKRIFTKEQIDGLLANPNIKECSKKSIGYSKNFKIVALKEWQAGVPPQEIFTRAGFDICLIGNETPKQSIRRWRKIYKEKGANGLKVDGRGKSKRRGRLKKNWQDDKEKIKYLEAKVAYLKAENDFLVRLRKKS